MKHRLERTGLPESQIRATTIPVLAVDRRIRGLARSNCRRPGYGVSLAARASEETSVFLNFFFINCNLQYNCPLLPR